MSLDDIVRRGTRRGRTAIDDTETRPHRRSSKRAGRAAAPTFQPREPRVSLLPGGLGDAGRGRRARRRAVGSLIAAAVVVALACGGVGYLSVSATAAQNDEQNAVENLSLQIAHYADVQKLRLSAMQREAVAKSGLAPAIDWKQTFSELTAQMPSSYTVSALSVAPVSTTGSTASSSLPAGTVATVVLTVDSHTIDGVPAWIDSLRSMPGYLDATPAVSTDNSQYITTVTVHLGSAAEVAKAGNR